MMIDKQIWDALDKNRDDLKSGLIDIPTFNRRSNALLETLCGGWLRQRMITRGVLNKCDNMMWARKK